MKRLNLKSYSRKDKLRFHICIFPFESQRLLFGVILKFSSMQEASLYVDKMKKDGVISADLEILEISVYNWRMLMSRTTNLGIAEYRTFYQKHFGRHIKYDYHYIQVLK